MTKCRTWKSAYGEGETCIYSIKNRPYEEIYDVNSSITVLMYLTWCDSAAATAPLDWFILAESLTHRQCCLLFSCWLRMNLNSICSPSECYAFHPVSKEQGSLIAWSVSDIVNPSQEKEAAEQTQGRLFSQLFSLIEHR